jgi:hypothetical protein
MELFGLVARMESLRNPGPCFAVTRIAPSAGAPSRDRWLHPGYGRLAFSMSRSYNCETLGG